MELLLIRAGASEESYFVVLVETGMVTAETYHELVHHLKVYAALVPLDEEMMVGTVRRRAVHFARVQIDRADVNRGADLESVWLVFDHPKYTQTAHVLSTYYCYVVRDSSTGPCRRGKRERNIQ